MEKKKRPQLVYAIKNIENNRIKIGITEDIKIRFSSLLMNSGCHLQTIYTSRKLEDARLYEIKIHRILKKYKHIGEWFNVDEKTALDAIISCIDMIDYDNKIIEQCQNINLNNYTKIDSGIYSDSMGNIYSISYKNSKWGVERLVKIK